MAGKQKITPLISNKDLMLDWDWERNKEVGFDPNEISLYERKLKPYWNCEYGHSWQSTPASRSRGSGCVYCSGRLAVTGENDLQTLHPELMKEWDWVKNGNLGLDPSKLKQTSNVRVWWLCPDYGHSYDTILSSRTHMHSNCPYCSGARILPGFNDLKTVKPNLAKEWNYDKNINLDINMTPPQAHYKAWWICENGHEWESDIYNRYGGAGCPYCAGNKPIQGETDLATIHPEILDEWDYEKNDKLPMEYTPQSHSKVWWKCEFGHSWKAIIKNRVNGTGCPDCNKESHSSIPEQTIYYYIKKYFHDAIWGYQDERINRYELDVFIPSLNVAIEYDGERWHQKVERDSKKDDLCCKSNIQLIRIREPKCPKYDSTCNFIFLKNTTYSELESAIIHILKTLHIDNYDIDVQRDMCEIVLLSDHKKKENSIAEQFPDIAKEWNYTKNGNLLPEHIASGSHRKVWWICKCGNEWACIVRDRVRQKIGCKTCRKINN